jgi:Ca2+-transporting ATPase
LWCAWRSSCWLAPAIPRRRLATLVVAFVVIILVNRSWTRSALAMLGVPNAALRWVVLGAFAFLAAVLTIPFAQALFHFAPLHATDLILSLGAGMVSVLWFEVVKLTGWLQAARA